MAVSQNGWPTIDLGQLDLSPIPGTSVVPVPGLRKGDVATVLLQVGKLFNERVAPVYNPGCWGFAPAIPIPGSNIISNHGSGTAIDLNAPSFPWKTRNMTPTQREACRGIVRELDGVVAWGGDFTTYVDEMHFEIIGSAEQVAVVAKRIKENEMRKPSYEEVLSYFRTFVGQDCTEQQQNYYVARGLDILLSDLLQFNYDRKQELLAAVGNLRKSSGLTDADRKEIERLSDVAEEAVKKIGEIAK